MKARRIKPVLRAIERYRRDLPAPSGEVPLCDRRGFREQLPLAMVAERSRRLPAWAWALTALKSTAAEAEWLRVEIHPRLALRDIRCELRGGVRVYAGREPRGCYRMESGRVYAPKAGGASCSK